MVELKICSLFWTSVTKRCCTFSEFWKPKHTISIYILDIDTSMLFSNLKFDNGQVHMVPENDIWLMILFYIWKSSSSWLVTTLLSLTPTQEGIWALIWTNGVYCFSRDPTDRLWIVNLNESGNHKYIFYHNHKVGFFWAFNFENKNIAKWSKGSMKKSNISNKNKRHTLSSWNFYFCLFIYVYFGDDMTKEMSLNQVTD